MDKDILDELFVDEGEINKELIHEILVKYVRFSPSGGIIPLEAYNYLNNDKKIMVIQLAKRVLALKGISSDFSSPKEVQELSGLPMGTVNPTLRILEDRRLLINERGKYKIPNHGINRLKSMLSDEKKDSTQQSPKSIVKRKVKIKTEKKDTGYAPIIKSLLDEGFFDGEDKWIEDVTKRLNEKGYNIHGRKVGAVASALTQMCRDSSIPLERKPVPKDKKRAQEKWIFHKTK